MEPQPPPPPAAGTQDSSGLRWQTADLLVDRRDIIIADTVAVFPFSGPTRLETDYCVRLGGALMRLIADAVRSGHCESRSGGVVDFITLVNHRALTPEQVFTFAYLTLSTSLDELSLDASLGVTNEPWPQVAQMVRRAVFEVLAAWTTRVMETPSAAAITDALTTLHTRPVLDLALSKECQRAERFEHWLSMILMDVDNLSEINRVHGYGVGDRVLERLGILVGSYFRHHDWVARYSEDAIAVLLPETSPADALSLAERTRTMIRERLTFRDYRTDQRASVSASVAVVTARALQGEPIDARLFLLDAEAAVLRAKAAGPGSVAQVEVPPRLMSIDEAATALNTDNEGIERLVASNQLTPVSAGRHVRLERAAVLRLAADIR